MKGIEDVMKAFFYILRELKSARLWIVGDGDKKYVEELKETMKRYAISPKVKFFGKVNKSKKFELLRKAHILLHASVKEGWGLVIIEAASQATPSVVYNVAGLRDSVKDGKTGVVLKENSCKEMATEAVDLFKDRRRYAIFQKNALAWAKSLTWEKATRQSSDLIKKVCVEKNS
jgi:glycosyltransferase involved in cell wall biosynthesis